MGWSSIDITAQMDDIEEKDEEILRPKERESMLAMQLLNATNSSFEMNSEDFMEFSKDPPMSSQKISRNYSNQMTSFNESMGSVDSKPANLMHIPTSRAHLKKFKSNTQSFKPRGSTVQPCQAILSDQSSIIPPSSSMSFDEEIMVNEEYVLMSMSSRAGN
jgi:hypothetical protein